jgi:hypothetical protein
MQGKKKISEGKKKWEGYHEGGRGGEEGWK